MDRIDRGLNEVHEGIADLRQEHERVAREQATRQAALVDAESRTRSLSTRAMAARRARHLRPNECFGPRRPAKDGTLVAVSPVDEKTQQNLIMMGLGRVTVRREP
jgi:hypothetical protein